MPTTPGRNAGRDTPNQPSPRATTEIRTVLGRLVGRSHSRSKSGGKAEDYRVTALIGNSKRPIERSPNTSPSAPRLFRGSPSPKRRRANALCTSPLPRRPSTTVGGLRASPSPAKPLPTSPGPPAIPLPESPLNVDFEEFETLFADFPLPPSATSTAVSSQPLSIPPLDLGKHQPKTRPAKAVNTIETLWGDLRAELAEEEEQGARTYALEKENQRMSLQLEAYRNKIERLEEGLQKEQEEKIKAGAEARGMIAHLEKRLSKEQEDRKLAVEAYNHRQASEETSDRRVFELQEQLDSAQQSIAKTEAAVKIREADLLRQAEDYKKDLEKIMVEREAGWAEKLAEAEFAHRALKEGGARLAKELAAKEKALEEMERGVKGGYRI